MCPFFRDMPKKELDILIGKALFDTLCDEFGKIACSKTAIHSNCDDFGMRRKAETIYAALVSELHTANKLSFVSND